MMCEEAMQKALVLSAGGMFGAWQVGAWRVLEKRFRPDLIVGASIGSLNGWAIAGGCSAAELEQYWLELGEAMNLRPHLPRAVLGGWIDGRRIERVIRELHARYRPHARYALVVTDLMRLRPRIFEGGEVTAEHLLASCAVPLLLDARRIGGRIYTDGGLLQALPEWVAFERGAEHAVSLNVLPFMPSAAIRLTVKAIRSAARFKAPTVPDSRSVVRLAPARGLGGPMQIMVWKRERIQEWIKRGEADTVAALEQNKTFPWEMF
jgi:NTE family protein